MLNPSSNSPEQQHSLPYFQQLLYKHPFLFCGGLWAMLVFVGGLATLGLFNPGPIEQDTSMPSPTLSTIQQIVPKPSVFKAQLPSPKTVEDKPTEKFTTTERSSTAPRTFPVSSLMLFVAVAIGCAGGSLLLTHLLRQAAQERTDPRGLKPTGTLRKRRRKPSPKRSSHVQMRQAEGSSANSQGLDQPLAITTHHPTQITVLPPEQSHPLDGKKESLAEMMDLRKRHSLASLMRNK
jgi:hypothetical protein